MSDPEDVYQRAYNQVTLFDPLVMTVLKTQRLTRIPFHIGENKDVPVNERLAHTLVMLNAQLSELLEEGVNPSSVMWGFMQSIQDSYVDPATNRECPGSPEGKRRKAAVLITDLINKAVEDKTLSNDMKEIL